MSDTLTQDLDTQTQTEPQQQPSQTPSPQTFTWKSQLAPDFANSPTMQKYADTKDGFNDAVKGHLELQKMLGHDKVPVPKGPDDPAMGLFKKAFGIPDKPEGYNLEDASLPDNMKELSFDKSKFSNTIHKFNLAPDQAKGLWKEYIEQSKQQYADLVKQHQDSINNAVNLLRQEWGDAYSSKVNLGQMVINKFFNESQEMNDWWTNAIASSPYGIKGLAKLGEQFSENKIGDFAYQRHSRTPEELQREIDTIMSDPNHPHNNPKATQADHDRAVEYMITLRQQLNKFRTR